MNASKSLKEAADVIASSSSALQLRFLDCKFLNIKLNNLLSINELKFIFRYLQTLTQIATEKNSTIIFPIPIEMFKGFTENGQPAKIERPGSVAKM